ncbi:MAG: CHAT domain-containing protein, partial [Cyclobacteriaceae bacterium]
LKHWSNQLAHSILQQDRNFIIPSNQIYNKLIAPIKDKVALAHQLIIVPDDVLSLINFETLVTSKPESERIYFPSFKDYLIYDHQISYAFSATTLKETHKTTKSPSKSFLGMAPNFENSFSLNGTFFDKLDWNKYEVEQISQLYKNINLVEEIADSRTFSELAPDYSLIHLATHAKADNSDGDLSYIAFGPNESNILYAKDLYALNLNADMVVLSACQTSAGPVNRGEGIISLARGFIYAGASSVVTSLWNVRERSNKTIILDFYKGLEKGLSKDQALRESKIRFLASVKPENQELAHPFFWAPLICLGDTAPYQKPFSSHWLIVIGVLLLLVGSLVFQKRFTSSKYRKG